MPTTSARAVTETVPEPHPDPAPRAPALAPPIPPGRDLTVDLLRAVAMVLVVVGHWLVVVPDYRDGRFGGVNALQTVPLMGALSWLFQVMPLFFAIGGYAGAASWTATRARGLPAPTAARAGGLPAPTAARAGGAYAPWLASRLRRLLAPTAVLLIGWAALCAALRAAGIDAALVGAIGGLVVVPVWFLSVYVVVTALVPVSLAAHRRFGWAAPVALAAAAAAIDVVRIAGGPATVAYANFFVVFVFAQQLGLWWRDGRVHRPGRLAVAGLVGLWLLTHVGPYPVSMVGVPGQRLANNAPPTLCLVVLALVQVGASVAARPVLVALLRRRAVARATFALNVHAMTILLWHFSALVLGALFLLPLGIVPVHPDGSLAWWLVRLATVVVLTPLLVALAAVVGRFERGGAGRATGRSPAAAAPAMAPLLLAVGCLSAGFAVVAVRGLSEPGTPLGLPLTAMALVGAGAVLSASSPDRLTGRLPSSFHRSQARSEPRQSRRPTPPLRPARSLRSRGAGPTGSLARRVSRR